MVSDLFRGHVRFWTQRICEKDFKIWEEKSQMNNQIQTAIDTEYVSWLFYLPRGVERLKELGMKKRLPREFLLARERDKTEYCYVGR